MKLPIIKLRFPLVMAIAAFAPLAMFQVRGVRRGSDLETRVKTDVAHGHGHDLLIGIGQYQWSSIPSLKRLGGF